ncbi:6-phosphogluconate dehydrogenase, decarboxylating [Aspergillus melleus]|uniref:6-phosphogluconate dehydrogenase, decarboxylating n=1 Tax=Aspergillus melleus TaxID=138277 RepID=UPI001E8DA1AA|nr:uncharacterized protein LDX57_005567 [Aspergillus melleus]KAH8427862.1 hypothetical protein LDX57_005567 [Aspergillus melleus]
MSTQNEPLPFKCIGIVGAGNMGSNMAFAFSEIGLDVSIWDVNHKNVDEVIKGAKEENYKGKISGYYKIEDFTKSLDGRDDRKLFIFSITHGAPADNVLGAIKDLLNPGDIILDGGNENYRRTERRQKECADLGVVWIGMGVSGGYQAARRGPSLSPGGDAKALQLVMPLLERYAAKDSKTGKPCVTRIGPAGSGHFVKMMHNGIEGGMLSTLAEAWSILHYGLGFNYDEIGDIFDKWNHEGELRNNYLLEIAVDMLHTKESDGYVLDEVLDKVVQDDDNTEGTPFWSIMDSAARHVSAPSLATAHYLRVASGNRAERVESAKKLQLPSPRVIEGIQDRKAFIETLRRAVYCTFLASFCQGLELIARASQDEGWDIDLGKCLQIWRAGCIIRSEAIADLLQPALTGATRLTNLKNVDEIAQELHKDFPSLKELVIQGTVYDQYIPSFSATLEYLKYVGGTELPTKFMEGQMDFFGAHSYDRPGVEGEDPGPVRKGPHHYEWRPA